MKKLTMLILLLLYLSINAQSYLLLKFASTGGYDSDAQTYFDALTTDLSPGRKATISQLFSKLKDSLSTNDLTAYFERFYLLANETAESSLKCIIKPAEDDAVTAGTITFAADRGYTSNGSSGYINAKFTPSTDAVVYAQNSASFAVYSRTNSGATALDMGVTSSGVNCYVGIRYATNTAYGRINQAASGGFNLSNSDSRGLFVATRTASALETLYRNSASLGSATAASNGLPDDNFYICCRNNGGSPDTYSTRQYAISFIGKGLNSTEVRKIYNCVEWYLDAIGAGVM